MTVPPTWWESFFDAEYLALWGTLLTAERTEREADEVWALLGLSAGQRVLDAPCGWGRLSLALAARGADVLGVDQSAEMIARADRDRERAGLAPPRLAYRRHDLRRALDVGGFDVALNVFSSLGYGTEADDVAVLSTLAAAVRPGGLVLVETMHRDVVVARTSRGAKPSSRLADGTLFVEEPRFDAITGRVETTWHWAGPAGASSRSASLRVYSATELVALLDRAGLRLRSAHAGCTAHPFTPEGPDMGGRLGLVAVKP
jgi:SAM-dependent methyltransferase